MTQQVNQSSPTYIIFHGYTAEVGDYANGKIKHNDQFHFVQLRYEFLAVFVVVRLDEGNG